MSNVLLMQKRLSDGCDVEFYKQRDGRFKYAVLGDGLPPLGRRFDKLSAAIEDFKTNYRDHTNEPLTTEEQSIIDAFNDWDGNLREMGSI